MSTKRRGHPGDYDQTRQAKGSRMPARQARGEPPVVHNHFEPRTVGQAPSSPMLAPQTGDRMKLDHGKAPWHLAPWDAFLAIVHVLAFGAAKYRARGWEEGMGWERLFSAAQRHLTDWFMRVDKGRGPGRDADTGYSDLWHCGCCVCFLIAYELRGETHTQHDSRPHVASTMAQFFPPKE